MSEDHPLEPVGMATAARKRSRAPSSDEAPGHTKLSRQSSSPPACGVSASHDSTGVGEQRTARSGCGCGSLFTNYKATKTFVDLHRKQEDPLLTTSSLEGDY